MQIFSKTFWINHTSDTQLVSWVFLRGLALIYLAAFASMAGQIEALAGENGILPLVNRLALMEKFYPEQKLWYMPTIFWLDTSDFMLKSVCYAGIASSILLLFALFSRITLIICYGLYLSVVQAGQDFTQFQWDSLLLETGFLAIFLAWGSAITAFLFRWLLARFMFISGIVKLASGDPNWANFTALNVHYETQPLPTPIAYYAHHLPEWFHKTCTGAVFFIELILPFFIFLPRRFRVFACSAFILLQSGIILTGNYTFFNLLTILLCIFLLEDKDISKFLPKRLLYQIQQQQPLAGKLASIFAGLWASMVMLVCASHIWLYHAHKPLIEPLRALLRTTATFSTVNNYGPFAVMTTKRHEIIVQGSDDTVHWSDYEFKYKPGNQTQELKWNIPHQPRLDWQMWFQALGPAIKGSWFESFLSRLLEGSPAVLSLLNNNPFPDKPPTYIRAIKYQYHYSSPEQRIRDGKIWFRRNGRLYWPAQTILEPPSSE